MTNYTGVDDAAIFSGGSANNNFGAFGGRAGVGSPRGLLRFNLATFAGNYARISSVTLTIEISQIQGAVTNGTINAYAILPANSGWVEGTANGTAQTGSSSWNFARNTTQSWAGSAGLSTAGVDYDSVLLGSFSYPSTGTYTMTFSRNSAQLKALITSWTNATNPGILLMEGNASRDGSETFYESEGLTKSRSPKLTITDATGPAIVVEQPAGTALDSGNSTVNCGSSPPGTAAAAKTFTIRNDGIATLSSIAVSATGGSSGDFVVSGLGATSLAPGASTTVTVTFTPGAAGLRTSTLAVTSNDTAFSPYNIALTGVGYTAIETWRLQYFGTISNSGSAADDADPDGDGVKNLAEFAFGLIPNNASSLATPAATIQGGNLVTSFTQSASVSGLTYGAEWSNDLTTWNPMTDSGSGLTHTFAVSIGSNSRLFLRWKITRP